MRTTFFGIEIGRRALQAQQRALDVTGHNIANANTPGYSRQATSLSATDPYEAPSATRTGRPGQVGTGVAEVAIERFRDNFLDREFRTENTSLGSWETRDQVLREIEGFFAEPSDAGLRTVLDKFWQSVQDLSNNPDSTSARALVVERGADFATTLNHVQRQLQGLKANLDADIANQVNEINITAQQIASLNDLIAQTTAMGDKPNDLKDKRDLLLDKLSKMADIRTVDGELGRINVMLNGVPLVEETRSNALAVDTSSGVAQVIWTHTGTAAEVKRGRLGALKELRDNDVAFFSSKLDELAQTFADRFNQVHTAGYGLDGSTGRLFFSASGGGTITAANIQVDPQMNNLDRVAAATTLDTTTGRGMTGDGSNAVRLAAVKKELLFAGGTAPVDGFYKSVVSDLAVRSQAALQMTDNQNVLLTAINRQRDSVSGVSLDEEMINMVRYQQAYNAAAKYINAVDEMIDTIVNRLGR